MRFLRGFSRAAGLVIAFCAFVQSTEADPVGDFFKKIGRTLSKPHQPPPDKTKARRTGSGRSTTQHSGETTAQTNNTQPSASPVAYQPPPATPEPSSTTSPVTIRRATRDPQNVGSRDVPYAVPVPNHPGFVTSPFAPTRGWVDVRGLGSGVEAKDPYTGKTFLTP